MLPRHPRSGGRFAAFACLMLACWVGGCSPAGTGTIEVKDKASITENLSKGAKPATNPKKSDDLGIKFRGQKGAD